MVNAGIWVRGPVPLHQMTTEQWRETLDADLNSAFYTCRAFLRHLADTPRESAAIILVGSSAALFGEANHANYAAAKAACCTRTRFDLVSDASRSCLSRHQSPASGD